MASSPKLQKILIIGQHRKKSVGGASTYVINLVNYLLNKGYEVIAVSSDPLLKDNEDKKEGKFTYHYIAPAFRSRWLSFYIYEMWTIRKLIKIHHPDIIDVHATMPAYGPAGLSLNAAKVLSVMGIAMEEKKHWRGLKGLLRGAFVTMFEGIILSRYRHIFVPTEYVKHMIEPYTKGKIHVNTIGIEEHWFDTTSSPEEKTVIAVGGVEPRKGYGFLLDSWKKVIRKVPDAKLKIIGGTRNKACYDDLLKKAKEHEIEDSVEFAGYVDSVKAEFEKAYLYTMSSIEESQGIAVIEAMATRTPVVASNIGGIPYITDKDSAILADYGDTDAFSKAMIKVLLNEKLREKMADAARELAGTFTEEKTNERTLEMYKEAFMDFNQNKL